MTVTNWKRKVVSAALASGAITVAAPAISNAQSTLIFDDSGLANDQTIAGTGYGDNLPGTPNITLDWDLGWENWINWDGRTDVGQLDYNTSGGNPIDLTFNPEAGFGVYVTSFDLDTWSGGGDTDILWQLLDGANVIDSGSYLNPAGSGRTNFTTNMSASNAVFGPLTLRFTLNSGLPNYQAADNISFAQIPEPSTAMLLTAGFGAMALRRRKS